MLNELDGFCIVVRLCESQLERCVVNCKGGWFEPQLGNALMTPGVGMIHLLTDN
jgi:hypothetical protein